MLRNPTSRGDGTALDHGKSRQVLEALGDDRGGELFTALIEADEPLSASELSERTAIPASTVYRKLDTLRDVGVVDPLTEYSAYGNHEQRYRAGFDEMRVVVTDEGYHAVLDDRDDDERS